MPNDQPARTGRPREPRLTKVLLTTTLASLAENGYEATTIAGLAATARTSKQAVYRRWPDKGTLIAAAIRAALDEVHLPSPQRGSVFQDLHVCLTNTCDALQDTPLGGAIRALFPYRSRPELEQVLKEVEEDRRLVMRQILIATPFEQDMETRIDLLIGLVYFRLLIRNQTITTNDIDTAIQLVLGLTPPRDPARVPVPFP
ncbi:TetR/AcrR family transcriptional regulator [Roseibium sp.]|uniref:TetR/AcrR family transcriptional regulator n=1 Tax=Roseibium sp. TaxID=1936156 RepID=UPI003A974DFA